MPSLDLRPRTMDCGVSALPAPDAYNPNVQLPLQESDPELAQVLTHLPEDWVYVRAYRVFPHPAVEAQIEAIEAQIEAIREQGAAQGMTEDQIEETIEGLESQIPEEAYIFERVSAVVSAEQASRLAELGLTFDEPEDDEEIDLSLDLDEEDDDDGE